MTKNQSSTLALVAFATSACGWHIDTTDDSNNSSETSGTTAATDEQPTGDVVLFPMHFACYNSTNYQWTPGGPFYFPLMHTCAQVDDPDNWSSDENMMRILDACSKTCQESQGGWNNLCTNEGWKGVEPTGTPCDPEYYAPEYGGGILWLDGVQSTDRQVTCDLHTTCVEAFGSSTPDGSGPSEALRHVEVELRVELGQTEVLLGGTLSYSTPDCGATACPLYLAELELVQVEASAAMTFDLRDLGRIDKRVSDLRIQLASPVLGISLSDGQIAFPVDALSLRVDLDVAGAESPLVENGTQSFVVRNPDVVLGRLSADSLEFDIEIPTMFGPVSLRSGRIE
ncbi:MAG: hypothetical protein JNL82_15315 [Myxococcales bacterium]|nr:hypothetical protein [Myxococcales bacterium]